MALIAGHSSRFGGGPLRFNAAAPQATIVLTANNNVFGLGGAIRNFPDGWASISGVTNKEGRPSGAIHPIAWVMPSKEGGLSSRNEADFSIAVGSANLSKGVALAGASDITFTVDAASLALITALAGTAAITFTQTLSIALASSLSGTATITFTQSGALALIANMVASGTITFSQVADLKGKAWLSGDITPFTELSPENLALAVWNQIIEAGYSAGDILRILAAVAAGETDIATGPVVVTFTGLDGVTSRVIADMTDSERTSVTIDADE